MAGGITTNFIDWDWSTKNILAEVKVGEYVSSESTILLAGPNRLDQVGTSFNVNATSLTVEQAKQTAIELIPLGKTMSFDLRQAKTNQPAYEIGARRAYILSDKQMITGDLRSVMFYSDSLLKILYRNKLQQEIYDGTTWEDILRGDKPGGDGVNPSNPTASTTGGSDYWGAFSSRIFTDPVGLCVIFRTNRDRPYGAIYIEDVVLNGYMMNINSTQAVMMEGAGFDASFVKPVTLTSRPTTITA